MAIGIDLDNTLIDYTDAYPVIAAQLGLESHLNSRVTIRNALRNPEGDILWQEFQSLVYTDGLEYARVAPGARLFLESCAECRLTVYLISHKTSKGPAQFGLKDLRTPASEWLRRQGIVPDLVNISNVSYHSTAADKIERIGALRLVAFVDDLVSILNHPNWPLQTRGILYVHQSERSRRAGGSADFFTLTEWLQGGKLQ